MSNEETTLDDLSLETPEVESPDLETPEAPVRAFRTPAFRRHHPGHWQIPVWFSDRTSRLRLAFDYPYPHLVEPRVGPRPERTSRARRRGRPPLRWRTVISRILSLNFFKYRLYHLSMLPTPFDILGRASLPITGSKYT